MAVVDAPSWIVVAKWQALSPDHFSSARSVPELIVRLT
jgi:hypothetical protein